jgi:hypothetical protein
LIVSPWCAKLDAYERHHCFPTSTIRSYPVLTFCAHSVDVKARQLYDVVLGLSSSKNEMPTCCRVMWQEFSDENGDLILASPPSGKGGSLAIRYALPRKDNVQHGLRPQSPKVAVSVLVVGSIFLNPRTLLTDKDRIADAALLKALAQKEKCGATFAPHELHPTLRQSLSVPLVCVLEAFPT